MLDWPSACCFKWLLQSCWEHSVYWPFERCITFMEQSERRQTSIDAEARPSEERMASTVEVFDQENFDAVAYINEMFPTGKRFGALRFITDQN